MPISVWQRIRALFTSRDDLPIEVVMRGNGLAALAVAAVVWFHFELTSIPWLAAIVAGVFLFLGACLLFRHTVWVAAGLGGLAIASSFAVVVAGLAVSFEYPWWIGGGAGAIAGLAVAYSAYARVGQIARSLE